MDTVSLATYLIAITLLTVTPGVDTLLVVRNTARSGWRDGAISSLGICSGLYVHAAISVAGISLILLQVAWAFGTLKLAGALYLVWLGLASWHKALKNRGLNALRVEGAAVQNFSARRSFREGFLSNALNPKTAVFYMAFLPQFIDPSQSALGQAMFLAGLHFIIAMLWQCFIALLVKQARDLLRHPRLGRIFDATTGTVMVSLGLGVAAES